LAQGNEFIVNDVDSDEQANKNRTSNKSSHASENEINSFK